MDFTADPLIGIACAQNAVIDAATIKADSRVVDQRSAGGLGCAGCCNGERFGWSELDFSAKS